MVPLLLALDAQRPKLATRCTCVYRCYDAERKPMQPVLVLSPLASRLVIWLSQDAVVFSGYTDIWPKPL